nr:putative nucleotidyltransferase, ribonuclease H [Tanacetum cinerariifolium]
TQVSNGLGNPQYTLHDQGIFDSGCSRHMMGNKFFLTDYQEIDGGFVAYGGNPKGDKIFGKVLLKVPRQNNMYNFDLKNVAPLGDLTCLFAKTTIDESNLWHRRLGHINFKTMNKLMKGNLFRSLPSKIFENDHICVTCQKGKQHKASCKTKLVSSISQPLKMLHMDLFGLTFIKSLNNKMYCLVVTDDFSRFSWVFFLASKDETSGILKSFITCIENQLNHRVKIIRCDNRTKFKNSETNQFCQMKGIKREFSIARTPQQNGVAKRKNRTLIENRVLVTKPHNKTPYELLIGRSPNLDFIRPFGCPVTILNTLDHLGKFEGKADPQASHPFLNSSRLLRKGKSKQAKRNEKPRRIKALVGVVVDRLTKAAHFLPIRKDYSVSRLAEIFQQEIVRLHGTPSAIVSDRDPRFASRFWKGLQKAWRTRLKFSTTFNPQTDGQSERTIQTLKDMLRSCALEWTGNWDDYICLVEFAYNNSWHASIKCVPFEMLYGRKCHALICWDQIGERVIEGPEMIEVTNAKVAVAKEKLKEARTRQNDKHRRSLEFQPGDHVFLKVSPARGVRRFGIKGKLSPRFIGPFEILDRVGEVSYRLALPPQLSHVHNVFHVSLLRGYKYHPLHVISYPLDQICVDLSYVEEPEAILDRQDRVMRKKTIPFVKILWRNHPEREATWETEESIRTSYPHFLP